jgi:ABC-type lipoprotein export system ATPase subunit
MLRIKGTAPQENDRRTRACLSLVSLDKWMHHRPYEMSGGQQQRVAIARALAKQPRLILADEPTGELDSATARAVLGLFREIVKTAQVTVLMVTHDPLVDEYADRVLLLKDGQIVA